MRGSAREKRKEVNKRKGKGKEKISFKLPKGG